MSSSLTPKSRLEIRSLPSPLTAVPSNKSWVQMPSMFLWKSTMPSSILNQIQSTDQVIKIRAFEALRNNNSETYRNKIILLLKSLGNTAPGAASTRASKIASTASRIERFHTIKRCVGSTSGRPTAPTTALTALIQLNNIVETHANFIGFHCIYFDRWIFKYTNKRASNQIWPSWAAGR